MLKVYAQEILCTTGAERTGKNISTQEAREEEQPDCLDTRSGQINDEQGVTKEPTPEAETISSRYRRKKGRETEGAGAQGVLRRQTAGTQEENPSAFTEGLVS